jgi:hypothetical protein
LLAYTVKAVIKALHQYSDYKTFKVTFQDRKEGTVYIFHVNKEQVKLEYGKPDDALLMIKVEDIEMLKLPKHLIAIKLEDISYAPDGKIYEMHTICVKYEAQLFIKVFRVMKDRVFFTVFHDKNYIDCYYIDGKLIYIEEDDQDFNVMITDLYKLHKTHENYKIVNINGLLNRYDFSSFLEEKEKVARMLGKKYRKFRDGHPI